MKARPAVFSAAAVFWLFAAGFLAFAGAVFLEVDGGDGEPRTAGANAFSYSAIGHRGLVEVLRRLDIPVLFSRNNSARKAGASSLLVIAEPPPSEGVGGELGDLLAAEAVLIVLPKWTGVADPEKPRWLEAITILDRQDVAGVLEQLLPDARLRRVTGPVAWRRGPFGVTPSLPSPQLVESARLRPIVSSDKGVLLGELPYGGQRVWLLSDPDILSNNGIGLADNAVLAVRVIEALRPRDGTVVIDETIHGFRLAPNMWRAAFEFPFAVPTALALVALGALMWSATGRFGAPLPARPTLESGKATLIDNMAGLLRHGGHGPEILRRYASLTLRDAARRLHAPRALDEAALPGWVDRIGAARGARSRYHDLRREIDAIVGTAKANSPRLARMARGLHRWKQEIINGP